MQNPWLAASRQDAACKTRRALLTAIPVLATSPSAFTQVLDPGVNKNAVCIAPAKLGGGFDLTCRLAAKALDGARSGDAKTLIQYLPGDRKSTRLNSSHLGISYAVFCLKKK